MFFLKCVLYPPPNILAACQKAKERGNDSLHNEVDFTKSNDLMQQFSFADSILLFTFSGLSGSFKVGKHWGKSRNNVCICKMNQLE